MNRLEIRPCRLGEAGAVLELWRRAGALESVTASLDVLELRGAGLGARPARDPLCQNDSLTASGLVT